LPAEVFIESDMQPDDKWTERFNIRPIAEHNFAQKMCERLLLFYGLTVYPLIEGLSSCNLSTAFEYNC